VPVEFAWRDELALNPVTDMREYGTYHQPAGTWSDDSSLALCLAESLTQGLDLNDIGQSFVDWFFQDIWTARGEVFDVGIGTREAIVRLQQGVTAELAGANDELSNGNGSLMRILPLLFHIKDKSIEERFEVTSKISSITHGHIRAIIACFYYLEFAKQLLEGRNKL